jgi:hypothetical protein
MASVTICKYHLDIGINYLSIPKNSNILSVGNQNDSPYIWVEINSEEQISEQISEQRILYVIETGTVYRNDIGEKNPQSTKKFIGTVLLFNGNTVLHVFEGFNK